VIEGSKRLILSKKEIPTLSESEKEKAVELQFISKKDLKMLEMINLDQLKKIHKHINPDSPRTS
jgi:hypothetical protein